MDKITTTENGDGLTAPRLHQYIYSYDTAGNRTGEQVDSAPVGANYNTLNQLMSQVTNGLLQFSGNITKTSAVTLATVPATMTNKTNFSGYLVMQPGTNWVQISAADLNGNTTTSNYQVVVSNNSVCRTLTYDLVGNLLTNATGTGTNTHEWDAENHLTAINEAGTNRTEFTYDGAGRRVQIVEKTNGVTYSTKRFLWCGLNLCEERDLSGSTVTKRFFGQGEQISGANYYFTKDHLGTVREMIDTSGNIHSRYDYDLYGRTTKISGDMDADFGFTGHYRHANSGLSLSLYRAYDPSVGRWLSRDPIEEEGGINLYAYVGNEPAYYIDLLGLSWGHALLAGSGVAGGVGIMVFAFTLTSPFWGPVVLIGGAVTVGLSLLKLDSAIHNQPSYLPSNMLRLIGRGIDCTLKEESRPGQPLGPFQTALDPVGFGFNFVPKAYGISENLQGMISLSESPPSPFVPPPAPFPKPNY